MAVSIYEALKFIEKDSRVVESEIISIEDAIGRISSCELSASLALPSFNNSAMDGYGLKGEKSTYIIKGKILAGDSHSYDLRDGECIRITTGAKVPDCVDSVIPQENCLIGDMEIKIKKDVKNGANIRKKGEDIDVGENILKKGDLITSAHIGLLASQGISEVEIYKRVRVGVFASGSELRLHHEELKDGQVYNSNTPYLMARSQELGCDVIFLGKSGDDKESIKSLVKKGLDCDIIVSSGGVSVGEADFTKESFRELGMDTIFEKVQVKPGKPTTFGKINDTYVLNLPGNPLASALNFEIFGKFLISILSGLNKPYHGFINTTTTKIINSPRPTSNIIPGTFDGDSFTPLSKYAPGNVNVLNHCNGIIVLNSKTDQIKEKESVKFLPIRWDFTRESFEDITS